MESEIQKACQVYGGCSEVTREPHVPWPLGYLAVNNQATGWLPILEGRTQQGPYQEMLLVIRPSSAALLPLLDEALTPS